MILSDPEILSEESVANSFKYLSLSKIQDLLCPEQL